MKKIYIIFGIFLLLIGLSSFSWASAGSLGFDFSAFNAEQGTSFANYDLATNLNSFTDQELATMQYAFVSFRNGSIESFYILNKIPYVTSSTPQEFQVDISTPTYGIYMNSYGSTYILNTANNTTFNQLGAVYNYAMANPNNMYWLINSQVYSDSSMSTLITMPSSSNQSSRVFLNDTFLVNSFLSEGGEGEGGEGGEGEGGDEPGNDNVTNTSLAEILLSVVVPTGDDWQDLQDTFEDTILSKFHITSMSFTDDLEYNWDNTGLYTPIQSAPTLSFGSWGTIDLSAINDLMHTPLSFGLMKVQFGSWEPVDREVETNGITLYDVVNFLLILDIFICNIVLYNKFFNKGGRII